MSKTNKIILAIIAIIAIIFVIFFINNKSKEEETIKIGVILPMSGDASFWGQVAKNAIEMAVRERNEKDGINGKIIEIIYEDTQGFPKNAVSAFEKLIEINKVDLIIASGYQSEVSAIAPLADRKKIPVIAPSYVSIENRINQRNPLCIWLDPVYEAQKMAKYVYEKGIKKISVIGTQDGWEKIVTNEFANHFKSLGGDVVFQDLINIDDKNVRTVVVKAMNNNSEAIFFGTYYQFLNLTRAFKELGFSGNLYSIEIDDYLANESKDFVSGLEFISSDLYRDDFRKKYEEEFKSKSNIPAGQNYDVMQIAFSFLEKGIDKNNILKEMENFSEFNGVSGKIEIDKDNKTIIPVAIYKLNNGIIEKILEMKNK